MTVIHSATSRYLRVLLFGTMAFLLLAVGFNRLIDPFGLFDGPHIEGINTNKPEFVSHLRMAKAAAVQRLHPRAIVLGTSRGEIGIDPQHPGWSVQPVYNLALSGGNIYEAYRYLQHTHALEPVHQVVLMLDFFMFNAVNNSDEVDFDEQRLAVSADGESLQSGFSDLIAALGSLDALASSLQTVRLQHKGREYRNDGFRFREYQARQEFRSQGGQRAAFQGNERGYFKKNYDRFSFQNPNRDNLKIYRRLLQLAYRDDIDLHIAISPSHARQFETIAAKGIWPLFEDWKRHLVRINEEEAGRLGQQPFSLWDFSGYNSLTTEPVPPIGDTKTEMRWYWESSHYKKELGDLVQDRIFGYSHPDRPLPTDFGIRLTPETLEPHLATIRTDRRRWRVAFPEDAAEIDALKSTQPPDKQ